MKHTIRHGVEEVMSLVLIVLFVTASQYAMAADRTGGIVGGKTAVDSSSGCSAGTWVKLMAAWLDINNGDNVWITYDAYWWDNRTSGSTPTAKHNYTLDVHYSGNSYDNGYVKHTNGAESGGTSFSVTIYSVQEGQHVFVNWTAELTGPRGTGCPAFSKSYQFFTLR